ncbi:hypothetical protein NliqN6_2011 [Naganishia liquefaciens]|uniref:AMP-dependent synthetase/ligase domain-containing protein n=1 Tax=Naganishia liquefaciens TaxID=104408 RepID=A0A8H3TSU4_9TREE|nr:hypothetical protein NliqN6_2011 [Naganishia liquefaciens]
MDLYEYPPNLDLRKQAQEIPGSKKPGYSAVWKNGEISPSLRREARPHLTACGLAGIFPDDHVVRDQPATLFELFERSVAANADRPIMKWRTLLTPATPTQAAVFAPTLDAQLTYGDFGARRLNVGKALLRLENEGKLGSRAEGASAKPEYVDGANFAVGVWSLNRPEWQIVDFACHAFGLVGVALYDTLGPNVVEYVTNHAPLSIIVASANHIPTLLKNAPATPCLRYVVSMDKLAHQEHTILKAWAASVGVELWQMEELERYGREAVDVHPRPPTPEMPATISYTSGTTGNPKGVVLTHETVTKGIICQASGQGHALQHWTLMSYLPLAHILERSLELLAVASGGIIAYSTGDNLRLLEDAQIIKPDFFPSVPRVLNRLHQAVLAQAAAGGLKGALLQKALTAKIEHFKQTGEVTHRVYDALVFRKVRALLGGNVKIITTGSAPISPDVLLTLKACFSCDVIEGYGLTETVGGITLNIPFDTVGFKTAGHPRPGVLIKLKDVPELNYTSDDKPYPRGEVLIGGPVRLKCYHKDPENTAKAIDEEGWFHTGDIGVIDDCGRLKIIDRVKNVMKLSQGEYVALEKVEGIYGLHPLFASFLVHGDSLQSYIVLIGVVDPVQASQYIQKVLGKNVQPTDLAGMQKLLNDPKVRQHVLYELQMLAKKNGLNGFETVKGVWLEVEPFPAHILTPTLKMKRKQAAEHYREQIDNLYAEGEAVFERRPLGKL